MLEDSVIISEARTAAKHKLGKAQSKTQVLFNCKAKYCSFQPGNQVLVLLSLLNSLFQAKFSGPYEVLKCVSDYNYLLSSPNRVQNCHINLKTILPPCL